MILLTHESRIQLGVQPADFRKGVDGFVSLCKNHLLLEPRDGTIFVFINRARTMIRALSYDGTGYWLMTKRLSRGKFKHWPTGQEALSAASARELRQIINGEPWQPQDAVSSTAGISSLQHPAVSVMVNPRASL
ncbi:IS66 family insertion sequence element accessory protein TnpB [Granulosicoccus sp. 3-233]|uniref:IS66 family insertion sequence element accessory protein TnpB n=1 Tax=Granulosicoccus sp. 3-233 TaxID=3417969 RepID=UPI003D32C419